MKEGHAFSGCISPVLLFYELIIPLDSSSYKIAIVFLSNLLHPRIDFTALTFYYLYILLPTYCLPTSALSLTIEILPIILMSFQKSSQAQSLPWFFHLILYLYFSPVKDRQNNCKWLYLSLNFHSTLAETISIAYLIQWTSLCLSPLSRVWALAS